MHHTTAGASNAASRHTGGSSSSSSSSLYKSSASSSSNSTRFRNFLLLMALLFFVFMLGSSMFSASSQFFFTAAADTPAADEKYSTKQKNLKMTKAEETFQKKKALLTDFHPLPRLPVASQRTIFENAWVSVMELVVPAWWRRKKSSNTQKKSSLEDDQMNLDQIGALNNKKDTKKNNNNIIINNKKNNDAKQTLQWTYVQTRPCINVLPVLNVRRFLASGLYMLQATTSKKINNNNNNNGVGGNPDDEDGDGDDTLVDAAAAQKKSQQDNKNRYNNDNDYFSLRADEFDALNKLLLESMNHNKKNDKNFQESDLSAKMVKRSDVSGGVARLVRNFLRRHAAGGVEQQQELERFREEEEEENEEQQEEEREQEKKEAFLRRQRQRDNNAGGGGGGEEEIIDDENRQFSNRKNSEIDSFIFPMLLQTKFGYRGMSLAVVGGLYEPQAGDVTLRDTAERELREELGMSCTRLTPLGSWVVDANRGAGKFRSFFARGCSPATGITDADRAAADAEPQRLVFLTRRDLLKVMENTRNYAADREEPAIGVDRKTGKQKLLVSPSSSSSSSTLSPRQENKNSDYYETHEGENENDDVGGGGGDATLDELIESGKLVIKEMKWSHTIALTLMNLM